jgi:hypothetical protein
MIEQLADHPDVRHRYRDRDDDDSGAPRIEVPKFVQDAALGLLKQVA